MTNGKVFYFWQIGWLGQQESHSKDVLFYLVLILLHLLYRSKVNREIRGIEDYLDFFWGAYLVWLVVKNNSEEQSAREISERLRGLLKCSSLVIAEVCNTFKSLSRKQRDVLLGNVVWNT